MNIKINLLIILAIFMSSFSSVASAGQTPFIGEVRFVGFNFAPRGWAKCDGQLLSINSNQALFSILGTTYGGDGRTTFGLPDMRGRTPIHPGAGSGLSNYRLGQKSGSEFTVLNTNQLPSHSHTAKGVSTSARSTNSIDSAVARTRSNLKAYDNSTPNITLNSTTVGNSGSSEQINNMQPYNTMYCIIALQGIFPSRS
jgi:microcystin-dependent protein